MGFFLMAFTTPCLPRTTERPVREREDECSELPAREAPQSHGRKFVVLGLPRHISLLSIGKDCK